MSGEEQQHADRSPGTSAPASTSQARSLVAPPGRCVHEALGPRGTTASVSGSLRAVEFNNQRKSWHPTIMQLGFYEPVDDSSHDRPSTVKTSIGKADNRMRLYASYEIATHGKPWKYKFLANLPLDATIRVSMTFNDGLATVQLNDQQPITWRTPFREVVPYLYVQSGTVEFDGELSGPLDPDAEISSAPCVVGLNWGWQL